MMALIFIFSLRPLFAYCTLHCSKFSLTNLFILFRFSSNLGDCENIEDPENEIQIIEDERLTSGDSSGSESGSESGETGESQRKFVQISPQKIRLKLRVGQEAKVAFDVAHAKQYPVDL